MPPRVPRRTSSSTAAFLQITLVVLALASPFGTLTSALAAPRSGGSFGGRAGFRSVPMAPRGPTSTRPPRTQGGGPGVFILPGFGWGGGYGIGGGGIGLVGTVMILGVLGLGVGLVLRAARRMRSVPSDLRRDPWDHWNDSVTPFVSNAAHVYKIQLGLGRSARAIQDRLAQFADEGNTATTQGLAQLLSQTALELMREKASIRYAFAESAGPMSLTNGETKMTAGSLAERSRFQIERVRGADGRVRRSDAPAAPTADVLEYVVVTILVATRTAVEGLEGIASPSPTNDQLETALTVLGAVPEDSLLGLEVIWTPADPEDALTTSDLITSYPELRGL